MRCVTKIYFRNISTLAMCMSIFIPLILLVALFLLYLYGAIIVDVDFSTMVTVVSLFIVTNITALMAFPKRALTMLYENDRTKYGDTLYDILISRYKYAMYVSFYFVLIFSIIFFSIKFDCKSIIYVIISSLSISCFSHILIVNINMFSYYFELLEISIMREFKNEKGDSND